MAIINMARVYNGRVNIRCRFHFDIRWSDREQHKAKVWNFTNKQKTEHQEWYEKEIPRNLTINTLKFENNLGIKNIKTVLQDCRAPIPRPQPRVLSQEVCRQIDVSHTDKCLRVHIPKLHDDVAIASMKSKQMVRVTMGVLG